MTPFEHIAGNAQIKSYLLRMVKHQTLGNSLLFAGPDGVGKSLFAQALAELLLGDPHHPDLHQYQPEGKLGLHSINAMRQLSQEVYMAPFKGNRKVFIIHQAERMLPYSSNALLKTFEEPPQDTVIILISSHSDALLPTIRSRCCTIRFQALAELEAAGVLQAKFGVAEDKAVKLASKSRGSLGRACMLLHEEGHEARKTLLQLLSQGKIGTYKELSAAADLIAGKVAQLKSKEDTEAFTQENLTAHQVQSLEKEMEGAAAMQMLNDAQALFDVVLGWYRDLQLLHANGNRGLLLHPDFEEELEQSLQRGGILPLEIVQKAIAQAKLALERSTSLNHCLETLFLQLNLL